MRCFLRELASPGVSDVAGATLAIDTMSSGRQEHWERGRARDATDMAVSDMACVALATDETGGQPSPPQRLNAGGP